MHNWNWKEQRIENNILVTTKWQTTYDLKIILLKMYFASIVSVKNICHTFIAHLYINSRQFLR